MNFKNTIGWTLVIIGIIIFFGLLIMFADFKTVVIGYGIALFVVLYIYISMRLINNKKSTIAKFRKMEAMYFVVFTNGDNLISDRRLYVDENPSIEHFHEWLEQQRAELEKETNNKFVISKINYITSERYEKRIN